MPRCSVPGWFFIVQVTASPRCLSRSGVRVLARAVPGARPGARGPGCASWRARHRRRAPVRPCCDGRPRRTPSQQPGGRDRPTYIDLRWPHLATGARGHYSELRQRLND